MFLKTSHNRALDIRNGLNEPESILKNTAQAFRSGTERCRAMDEKHAEPAESVCQEKPLLKPYLTMPEFYHSGGFTREIARAEGLPAICF